MNTEDLEQTTEQRLAALESRLAEIEKWREAATKMTGLELLREEIKQRAIKRLLGIP